MSGAKTVKAIFKKPTYSLSITTVGEGTVSKQIVNSSSVTEYEGATTLRLTATPANNWSFKSWSGDISSTSNPVTIEVNANKAVTATFEEKDSDNDGVPDSTDTCPNTPSGASVDTNGCASSQKDSDGDGVKDNLDQCPDTPAGETVNSNGCSTSERDTDGDGVIDSLDNCANTPNGAEVDENGCPFYFTINDASIPDKVSPGGQIRLSWDSNYTNKTLRIDLVKYDSGAVTILNSNLSISSGEYIWLVSPTIAIGFYQLKVLDQSTNQEIGSSKLIQVEASCEQIPMQDSVFERWLFDNGYDNLLDNKVDSCKMAEITELVLDRDDTDTIIDWSIFTSLESLTINMHEVLYDFSEVNLKYLRINGLGEGTEIRINSNVIETIITVALKWDMNLDNYPNLKYFAANGGSGRANYNSFTLGTQTNSNLEYLSLGVFYDRSKTIPAGNYDLSIYPNLNYFYVFSDRDFKAYTFNIRTLSKLEYFLIRTSQGCLFTTPEQFQSLPQSNQDFLSSYFNIVYEGNSCSN
jgi:hypothetical protein